MSVFLYCENLPVFRSYREFLKKLGLNVLPKRGLSHPYSFSVFDLDYFDLRSIEISSEPSLFCYSQRSQIKGLCQKSHFFLPKPFSLLGLWKKIETIKRYQKKQKILTLSWLSSDSLCYEEMSKKGIIFTGREREFCDLFKELYLKNISKVFIERREPLKCLAHLKKSAGAFQIPFTVKIVEGFPSKWVRKYADQIILEEKKYDLVVKDNIDKLSYYLKKNNTKKVESIWENEWQKAPYDSRIYLKLIPYLEKFSLSFIETFRQRAHLFCPDHYTLLDWLSQKEKKLAYGY